MNRIEVLKQHYEPRLEKFKDNSKVLDWESKDAQYSRFYAMIDNIDLNGRSILDVGCGCGDLFGLLNEIGLDISYTGVDILDKMVERALSSFSSADFRCSDIFGDSFEPYDEFGKHYFDIVFTSGIFNLNAGNNEEFLKKAVPVIASLSEYAFIFNLLDPDSPDRDDKYFYYEPEKAVELASEWAGEIKLIKGYLANDYTLICKK